MLKGSSKPDRPERSYGRPTFSEDQDDTEHSDRRDGARAGQDAPDGEAPLPVTPAPLVQAVGFGADGKGVRQQEAVPWRPVVALLYALLLFVVAQFVAAVVMLLYATVRGWPIDAMETWLNTSIVAQFWYVLIAESLTFGGIWWFVRRRGASLRIIGWKRPRWADPLYALGGFAVYFLTLVVTMALVTQLVPSLDVDQKQELGFDNVAGNTHLLLTFISLVVLPPIVEELVFRGFIFTSLRGAAARRGRLVMAALVTSVLFAMAHLQFGNGQPLLWVAAIDTFILSLVLCYLRQKTDRLWAPISLHAIKNSVAFVALFVIGVQ